MCASPVLMILRHEGEHQGVDPQAHFRGVGGAGEQVENVADPVRVGIDQMETLAVQPGEMSNMVHRVHDEIDRHQILPTALDADHRHPRRQQLAHFWISLKK
jgi:hypothetical protein